MGGSTFDTGVRSFTSECFVLEKLNPDPKPQKLIELRGEVHDGVRSVEVRGQSWVALLPLFLLSP